VDHHYIDEHSLADRYLDHDLPPKEGGEFEAHLVDCQECRDRLLLAEMFHARNDMGKPTSSAASGIRLLARLSVSRLVLIFAAAAAAAIVVLVASTAVVFSILRSR